MKILVGCEHSGVIRDALTRAGHDATSCDLLPAEMPGQHYQGDVRDLLRDGNHWDGFIVHPDCTNLCASGLHWNHKVPGRAALTEAALEFVREMLAAYDRGIVDRLALENPVGCISTRIEKPAQYIQPYNFGENASKKTGLWLRNLPLLKGTSYFEPRIVQSGPHTGAKRWKNQSDAGQNNVSGGRQDKRSEIQWKIRSATYNGIAEAIASQWFKE